MTGGSNLRSRTGIRRDYGRLCVACLMVDKSAPPPVADLLSLAICGVEAMVTASILKVRFGGLEPAFSSNNTFIGEPESQLASKSSQRDAATVELESTDSRLRLA